MSKFNFILRGIQFCRESRELWDNSCRAKSLVSERLGVLGFWVVSQNITILVILISLVKYFPFVFAHERRLKAEPRNLWCSLLCLFFIFLQFHFSCVSASPTNFLTVVSELLVVFLESGIVHVFTYTAYDTIHVYGIQHYSRIRHTALFTYTVYGTIHVKRWKRSKNFPVQSRE